MTSPGTHAPSPLAPGDSVVFESAGSSLDGWEGRVVGFRSDGVPLVKFPSHLLDFPCALSSLRRR